MGGRLGYALANQRRSILANEGAGQVVESAVTEERGLGGAVTLEQGLNGEQVPWAVEDGNAAPSMACMIEGTPAMT